MECDRDALDALDALDEQHGLAPVQSTGATTIEIHRPGFIPTLQANALPGGLRRCCPCPWSSHGLPTAPCDSIDAQCGAGLPQWHQFSGAGRNTRPGAQTLSATRRTGYCPGLGKVRQRQAFLYLQNPWAPKGVPAGLNGWVPRAWQQPRERATHPGHGPVHV